MNAPAPRESGGERRQSGSRLAWIGAMGIVSIAVMRCCIAFAPQLVFDADPALDSAPIAALGMGGSLVLDIALIIACLIALVGEWRGGRGLDPVLLLLALIPAPIILWHGAHDAGDIWRGGTWLAAAIGCVTIAHLARDRAVRIVITAVLLAAAAPLLIRGATQMTWEHDDTVAAYRAHKDEFLRSRGWRPDSPAALIYERRLSHREPTGWFPSTNIYGSIAGAAMVAFAGLGVWTFRAYRRGEMQSGAWFAMTLLAVACGVALKFTTSMGALLATGAGFIVLLSLFGDERRPVNRNEIKGPVPEHLPRWTGALVLLLIFGAIGGVIVRGAILPEGFLGEKSLLFRWHYWQAAAGIFGDSPWLGSGPSHFQRQYVLHRVPRNPEEVQSAHSMFVDWFATMGIAGGAWVAMIIALVARTGGPHAAPARSSSIVRPPAFRCSLIVAALALLPAIVIEWPALADIDLFVRGLIVVGFIGLTLILAGILNACGDRCLRGAAITAAAVLLVHGQIEMTFFQNGSVVWVMAVVGLIGAARPLRSPSAMRICGAAMALALLACAGWLLSAHALPALRQERLMLKAARMLAPLRERSADAEAALRLRPLAADTLIEAYELWPTNNQPINAAVDQLTLASQPHSPGEGGAAIGLLMRAEELADRAAGAHDSPSSIVRAMDVHAGLAALTDDSAQWARAVALGLRMTEIDPHGIGPWQRLGDMLWAAGAKPEAADAYRRALSNSANFELDALKQLQDAARARLQSRIDEAVPTPRTPTTHPQ